MEQNETNNYLMDKVDKLENSVADIKVSIAEIPQKILEACDKRYAPISIVDNLKWITRAIVISAIGIIVFVIEQLISK